MLTAWPTDRLGRPKLRRLILGRLFHRRLATSRPGCRQIGKEVVGKLISASNRTARGIAACQPFAIRCTLHCAFVVAGGAQSSIQAATASSSCRYSAVACVTKSGGARPCSSQSAQPSSIQARMPGSSDFRTPEEVTAVIARSMARSYHDRI